MFVPGIVAVLALASGADQLAAQTRAELVSTAAIWDRAARNTDADLVRFDNRWFLVCQESNSTQSPDSALRVLTSADGKTWEAVALLLSPTANKGLSNPKLTIAPDGRLMVSAHGIVPNPNSPDPVPKYGGTVQTLAWISKDGQSWGEPQPIGPHDYPISRVSWQQGVAFSYGFGCICGSAQTIQVFASKDGKQFESLYEKTFTGFFPEYGALVFKDDTAHCLVTRVGIGNRVWQPGLLGTARAPYTEWIWKDLDARISSPTLLRLPDGRVLAAVGLFDQRARTSLCEFDPASGKLTELLELPTGGHAVSAGLAMHDGQLWVSYHASHEGRLAVHLSRVRLK